MAVPERIALLVEKWRKRTLTSAEKTELDSWYHTAMPEILHVDAEISESDYRDRLLDRIHERMNEGRPRRRTLLPAWARIAAMFLLISAASFFTFKYLDNSGEPARLRSEVTRQSAIRRIVLPDSSIVWLKGNSRIAFPESFATRSRQVELHGEALFEVRHHDHWPFKIASGNITTTVLGTSFNINTGRKEGDYAISVLTGRVQVLEKRPDRQDGVFYVNANQVFQAASGLVKSVPAEKKVALRSLVTRGTTYDMDFEKMPFEDIMHQFAAKFDMEFEGYTGEYKACRITADLTGLPMERALKLLCLSINATYKITGNKIKLTGGGCF